MFVDDKREGGWLKIYKMADSTNESLAINSHSNEINRFTYRLETGRKLIFGVLIVLGIALSWVGSSQFTENTYTKSFHAPAFMMWFSTSWMMLSYLPVIIFNAVTKKSIRDAYRLLALPLVYKAICICMEYLACTLIYTYFNWYT